jgi:hypothetical protein
LISSSSIGPPVESFSRFSTTDEERHLRQYFAGSERSQYVLDKSSAIAGILGDMKVGLLIVGFVASLLLGIGCSGDDSGNGNVGGNGCPNENWADVHPPASIDIASCASIVDDGSGGLTALNRCSECCNPKGYQVSGFINQGKCTCANPTPSDTTTCAAAIADGAACSDCCQTANYLMSLWVGGDAASCSCDGRTDASICKNTLSCADPADQCSLCCLNHGFISDIYVGYGTRECSCAAP